MRTGLIMAGGFLLWGLCLLIAHFAAGLNAKSVASAALVFAGLWFVAAAANLWVGVTKAGYAFTEELPIFILIFAVPVAVAFFVKWKGWGA